MNITILDASFSRRLDQRWWTPMTFSMRLANRFWRPMIVPCCAAMKRGFERTSFPRTWILYFKGLTQPKKCGVCEGSLGSWNARVSVGCCCWSRNLGSFGWLWIAGFRTHSLFHHLTLQCRRASHFSRSRTFEATACVWGKIFVCHRLTCEVFSQTIPCALELRVQCWCFPPWAMYIAQRVHQCQATTAGGEPVERVLADGRPAPPLGKDPILVPYADNLNSVGVNKQKVRAMKDRIRS